MMSLPGRLSIRQKLNLIVMLTTALALLLAAVALVLFDLRNQKRTIESSLQTQADIIGLASSAALTFDDVKVASENLSVVRANPNIVAAALYDDGHQLFATYAPSGRGASAIPAAVPTLGVYFDREWAVVSAPLMADRERIGTVYLQARHHLTSRVLEHVAVLFAILSASLGGALLLSNRLQRLITGPIVAVSEVARDILQERNFGLRARRTSDDEVGALVDAFNAMLDELDRRARTLESANKALRASEARYQLAVRGSSAGLWDWDIPAGTMFYSPRFKAVLGYSDQEFPDLPSSMLKVLHPEDLVEARRLLRLHLRDDKPFQIECRLQLRSGAWCWFLVAGMAQKDVEGRAYRMAGSIIDVTERKTAEQTLQEANRAKDEFIATLAHELRNPLAPIRTGLELLKRDKANGPASERARLTMERQLAHMVRLVDDLLDISRISSGKIRLEKVRTRLAGIVDSAIELARPAIEAGGHQLQLSLPAQDVLLDADPTRLAQALGNLLNNAAKYTPAGGRIEVRARQEFDTAVIEIEDNGTGIPGDMLEQVFSLFTQVGRTIEHAQGGLGIGLSLVRSLVELHGGTVSAASPGPGQGSTFSIRIPCHTEAQVSTPAEGETPIMDNSSSQARKVLVVDDNVDAAATLAAVLDMLGHQTRMEHTGATVLAAAHDFGPDIVLLDIGLPGMNGYDVARQLRADSRLESCLLVALTGWGSEADRQRAHEAGFDHHLTKPVDFKELEALLEVAPDVRG